MMNLFALMQQFKQNPMALLQQRYNLPQGLNSPDQIIKHLVDSGQVSQQQLNQVMWIRNMFK